MDFNTAIDIIIKDLREAREIIDDFRNYPDVPQIQIELAKSKCKSAEQIIALLKTMKKDFKAPTDHSTEDVKVKKPSKAPAKGTSNEIKQIVEDKPSYSSGIELKENEISKHAEKKEPGLKSEIFAEKKIKGKSTESNIVADKFSAVTNIFNEQHMNKNVEGDISAKIKSRPVSNLFEAIGINDKFLFVREIFNGDQISYNEAISKLNKVENLADAKAVIMSYTGESEENVAVKQLLELVKRKLPSDE